MRILVIEDDLTLSSYIAKGLKQAGFAVDGAADGEEGLALAELASWDAMVVDIMLPKLDGLSLIERLRRKGLNTPVLILSARQSVDDRVKGLRSGGDDYLTKPFSFAELLARLQALIRRSTRAASASRLAAGDLSLDLISRKVERGGQSFELQPREFALLEYLMRNPGSVLSKTMILEHVWDYHFDPQTNVVDVLIHRLRNKIDRGFETKLIHTVHGIGYVLKVP